MMIDEVIRRSGLSSKKRILSKLRRSIWQTAVNRGPERTPQFQPAPIEVSSSGQVGEVAGLQKNPQTVMVAASARCVVRLKMSLLTIDDGANCRMSWS